MTPSKNIEKIKAHPLFLQLTPMQQLFVECYLQTQDRVASVRASGSTCTTDKSAEVIARKNLKHPIIKQLIAMAFKYEPTGGIFTKNELLLTLSDHMRKAKGTDFFRLATLFKDLKGWTSKNATPDISTLVVEMEEQRRKEARTRRKKSC